MENIQKVLRTLPQHPERQSNMFTPSDLDFHSHGVLFTKTSKVQPPALRWHDPLTPLGQRGRTPASLASAQQPRVLVKLAPSSLGPLPFLPPLPAQHTVSYQIPCSEAISSRKASGFLLCLTSTCFVHCRIAVFSVW